MGNKEVIDYVMNSPGNTNRAVLKGLLNSVTNLKKFDIFFSSETKTVNNHTFVILHPILLSTDLAMEDFLGARVFYTEERWDYVTHSSEAIVPVVTLCTQVYHFSEELPNVYSLYYNFDDDNLIYDSETGVLIADYTTRMRQYFGEKNTYTAEEFKQMFTLTRDMLTGNVPRITIEAHDTEDQQVNAKITFSVPAKEFCNAGACVASYDIGASESQGYDSYSASEVYGLIGTVPGGGNITNITRSVQLGEAPFMVWVTINQSTDEPIVEIRFGSGGVMLYQADDEGKVFTTEVPE